MQPEFCNIKSYIAPVSGSPESPKTIKPFYHTNFQNSLEKVVLKLNKENNSGLIEKIFSDKTQSLNSTIKSLLDEIKLREKLDIHLLNKINSDIFLQYRQLKDLSRLGYVVETPDELNKRRSSLESNIIELEQEKRKEYLECWRDLMELKKYLLLALKEFWELAKKQNLLSTNNHEIFAGN